MSQHSINNTNPANGEQLHKILTVSVGLCEVYINETHIAKPVSINEVLPDVHPWLDDDALTFVGDELGAFDGLDVAPTGALVGD